MSEPMSEMPVNPIRVLVLADSDQVCEVIAGLLQAQPGFTVTTAGDAYGEGYRAARQALPDVILLVADSLVSADPVAEVEELEAAAPGAAVVVLGADGRSTTRDFYLAGARDCLMPPYDHEKLAASLRQVHLHERRRRERLEASIGSGQRKHRCKTIAVHGVKGGVGTTSIAVNLAVALRQLTDERVVVFDASLQSGDVGVALNLTGNTGIDDLVSRLDELDVDLLNRVLVTHPSGVRALLAPRELERVDAIGGEEIRKVMAYLTGHFDYVVVDTAHTLDPAGLAVLDHSDQIVLLTTPEVPSLRNAGRFIQLTKRLGYPASKTLLVLNRAGSRSAVSAADVEKSLGWRPAVAIPSAGSHFIKAVNNGEVIVKPGAWRGPAASLLQLARQLAVTTKAQRGFKLGRLLRRSPAEDNPNAQASANPA